MWGVFVVLGELPFNKNKYTLFEGKDNDCSLH